MIQIPVLVLEDTLSRVVTPNFNSGLFLVLKRLSIRLDRSLISPVLRPRGHLGGDVGSEIDVDEIVVGIGRSKTGFPSSLSA